MHVSADKFEIKRLSISTEGEGDSRRVVLKYDYKKKGVNILHLALDKECYITCKGVYEETYGVDNVKTGKHVTTFILDKKSSADKILYNVLTSIYEKIQKYDKRKTVNFPMRENEDESICYMYCKFIEGKNEMIYTKAFDSDRNMLEIVNLRKCLCRPLFSISYPITKLDKANVRFSIFEMEVNKILES